ncbi:MAG: transporter [Deltaproteobacteria bacterium RBG_16_48_10]|nr:MAG: transporter [Deltaproteobacteria bacterium RBG_16_48_10]
MERTVGLIHRRKSLILRIVFTLFLFFSFFPFTATLGEGKGVQLLTLDEALRITAEKNKDIQKAREYRSWVEARYVEERAVALPQVVITARGSGSRDESQKAFGSNFPTQQNILSGGVGVSQPIFTWGQIGASIRAARVGLTTAEDQLRIYRQAAYRDVSASFYDILLAKTLNNITIENLEQKNRHYDEAQKKYSAGVATDYDVLAGKVDVENARPAVIRTENLIRITQERFRFLLGIGEQEVDADGNLETVITEYPKFEEAVETAWKKRLELSDLRHRIEIGKELVKIANAGDKPRLDFKGGLGWSSLDMGGDSQADGSNWSAGLFVTFPIFDGLRTRGKVGAAKSDLATLRIEEAKIRDSISLQVRDACNAVSEAGEIVKALSGTVTRAERLLFMGEKGYEYGVKTRLDVDDAQTNLVQARGNLAQAKRDYLVALVNLEWVMGTLGEKR